METKTLKILFEISLLLTSIGMILFLCLFGGFSCGDDDDDENNDKKTDPVDCSEQLNDCLDICQDRQTNCYGSGKTSGDCDSYYDDCAYGCDSDFDICCQTHPI